MKNIKVVIGLSYGDEGKGLMTDYFSNQATQNHQNCIVVCCNGGSQRGHTVETPDGRRHVFHHFSSGTFCNADTYLAKKYICNPMVFCKEYMELKGLTGLPKTYVHKDSIWSTPYDMMLNQIIEDSRGKKRHGSCGYGIWETILRNQQITHDYQFCDQEELRDYLIKIRFYVYKRLECLNITPDEEWNDLLQSETLMTHFINDFFFFTNFVEFVDDKILENYDNIIFENGQGILLDQNQLDDTHTTPSNTGLQNPSEIINQILNDTKVEVCYVSRSYLTRHGNGPFPEECKVEEINKNLFDKTNIQNTYQGHIRYGKLDKNFMQRGYYDFQKYGKENWKISFAITHLNEYPCKEITKYRSDGHTRESVKIYK